MQNKNSIYPCPICHNEMVVIKIDEKGRKVGSCGHAWRFKKTRSSKMLDRKYVSTPFGLELKSEQR